MSLGIVIRYPTGREDYVSVGTEPSVLGAGKGCDGASGTVLTSCWVRFGTDFARTGATGSGRLSVRNGDGARVNDKGEL